jgi:hypothetical protein
MCFADCDLPDVASLKRDNWQQVIQTPFGGESGDGKCRCTTADVADEHFRQVADRRK